MTMLRPMRRRLGAGLAAAALALALTACGGTDPSPTAALQDGVVAIADAAAAGDTTSALARVDALQQQLTEALDAGTITADTAARIQAALDVVRADLTALIPVPETPVLDSPTPDIPADESPTGDSPTVSESPSDEKVNSNNGNGNNGKGKGEGNSD